MHGSPNCETVASNGWRGYKSAIRGSTLGLAHCFGLRIAMQRSTTISPQVSITSAEMMDPKRMDASCPWQNVRTMLRKVGLRPTRQRMELGWILYAKGDRHLTAEMLFEEASKAKVPVSLATVYNTLNQFTDAGLLRQVAVDGSKTYFDTNVTDHHHFFVEGDNALVDIPSAKVTVSDMPVALEGYEIARVEVVVRLKRKSA